MAIHFNSIKKYNQYFNIAPPKKEFIDVVRYDDYQNLRLESSGITSDFYMLAFKRNMTDLRWYGNTDFDTKSGFLYFISPDHLHKWNVKQQWSGYHILINPILIKEKNINFSFFNYEINEALFLTVEEQTRVENLFEQIHDEYQKDDYSMNLLMAYSNLFLTYVQKCYQRQFKTREPLYNKLIIEFKEQLNTYYLNNPTHLPSVSYFANKLNLSTNYFSDLIKHHIGKTALEVIHEKIILEAKRELRNSFKTISEIGYDLGFEYPTYFARLFKKHTGLTPSQFRQNKI